MGRLVLVPPPPPQGGNTTRLSKTISLHMLARPQLSQHPLSRSVGFNQQGSLHAKLSFAIMPPSRSFTEKKSSKKHSPKPLQLPQNRSFEPDEKKPVVLIFFAIFLAGVRETKVVFVNEGELPQKWCRLVCVFKGTSIPK